MMRYLAPLVAFAIMIPVFMVGLKRDPTMLPSPFLDKPAPEFQLPKLQDLSQTVSSADYAGQVALINVWATWCVGCREEHDFLVRLSQENPLPIYGLNWRDQHEDAVAWLQQLASQQDLVGRWNVVSLHRIGITASRLGQFAHFLQ